MVNCKRRKAAWVWIITIQLNIVQGTIIYTVQWIVPGDGVSAFGGMEWWNGMNGGMEYWNGILEYWKWNSYMRRTVFFMCDVCQFSSCLGSLINGERRGTRKR